MAGAASRSSAPRRSRCSFRAAPTSDLPDWTGQPCVVIASGPSAPGADLALSRGRARHIAVNTSVRLCPWADILYAADRLWWKRHRADAGAFAGLKVSVADLGDLEADAVRVRYSYELDGFSTEPGVVSHMGNSGAHAVNLALLLGASRIVLVGFDLQASDGLHWHGDHGDGLSNPQPDLLRRWRRNIDRAAPSLAAFGAEVVNASPDSALEAYPKMPFPEAVAWLTR